MATNTAADPSAVQASGVKKAKRQRPRGHVKIFDIWCKGCGLCIEFCPQGVFEASVRGRPIIVHPEKCTACDLCAKRCPDMAIAVRRLDADEVSELAELADLAEQGVMPVGGDL